MTVGGPAFSVAVAESHPRASVATEPGWGHAISCPVPVAGDCLCTGLSTDSGGLRSLGILFIDFLDSCFTLGEKMQAMAVLLETQVRG